MIFVPAKITYFRPMTCMAPSTEYDQMPRSKPHLSQVGGERAVKRGQNSIKTDKTSNRKVQKAHEADTPCCQRDQAVSRS